MTVRPDAGVHFLSGRRSWWQIPCAAAAGIGLLLGGVLGAGAQGLREPPDLIAACALCHGDDGIGRDVEIPNLAGQYDVYLAIQLRAFQNGRRKHPDMSILGRDLDDAEIDGLARYYASLPPR